MSVQEGASQKGGKAPAKRDLSSAHRETLGFYASFELAEAGRGALVGNLVPADARLSDIVTGDEIGNGPNLDVSKLQVLAFTLLLFGFYALLVWQLLAGQGGFAHVKSTVELPALPIEVVQLFGVSHLGYAGSKLVPRTTTT
jgi:hypothetical protein